MNAVIYYSNTGQSRAIAAYVADKTGYKLIDIYEVNRLKFDNLVIVFPVHSQLIPDAVAEFLKKAIVKNLTAIATYGRMCHGNVLSELQKRYGMNVVAAAYVPTKHTYLNNKRFDEWDKLSPLIEKIKAPSPVKLPRLYKNPFAWVFPKARARAGVKILKTAACTGCGACEKACPIGAINAGVTNKKCIRCLRCVAVCPKKALFFERTFFMRLYLNKKPVDKTIVYV